MANDKKSKDNNNNNNKPKIKITDGSLANIKALLPNPEDRYCVICGRSNMSFKKNYFVHDENLQLYAKVFPHLDHIDYGAVCSTDFNKVWRYCRGEYAPKSGSGGTPNSSGKKGGKKRQSKSNHHSDEDVVPQQDEDDLLPINNKASSGNNHHEEPETKKTKSSTTSIIESEDNENGTNVPITTNTETTLFLEFYSKGKPKERNLMTIWSINDDEPIISTNNSSSNNSTIKVDDSNSVNNNNNSSSGNNNHANGKDLRNWLLNQIVNCHREFYEKTNSSLSPSSTIDINDIESISLKTKDRLEQTFMIEVDEYLLQNNINRLVNQGDTLVINVK
ncbi:hypothetical protein ABK040_000421 [Willaertia magna]